MNNSCYLTGHFVTTMARDELNLLYQRRFRWSQGRQVNTDAKLVHIACDNSLKKAGLKLSKCDSSRVAVVMGTSYGGLESYENFQDSMAINDRQPLAFANAIPGIPTTIPSLYYGITGPVMTLSGEAFVGSQALYQAIYMLENGICDIALTGAWYVPSSTSLRHSSVEKIGAAVMVLETANRVSECSSVHFRVISATMKRELLVKAVKDIQTPVVVIADNEQIIPVSSAPIHDVPGVGILGAVLEAVKIVESVGSGHIHITVGKQTLSLWLQVVANK